MIKKYRKQRGFTQKELGEIVGLKHNTIATYESGRNAPEQNMIFKIADALRVSIKDLYPEQKDLYEGINGSLLENSGLDIDGIRLVSSIIERLKSSSYEENMEIIERISFAIDHYDRFKKEKLNMSNINYSVSVESKEQFYPLYQASFHNENKAIEQAEEWTKEHSDKKVFVRFHRSSDGQTGYINREGPNMNGVSWTK